MTQWAVATVVITLLCMAGSASAGAWAFSGDAGCTNCEHSPCNDYGGSMGQLLLVGGVTYTIFHSVTASFDNYGCVWCNSTCGGGTLGTSMVTSSLIGGVGSSVCGSGFGGSASHTVEYTPGSDSYLDPAITCHHWGDWCCDCFGSGTVIVSNDTSSYTASGTTVCIALTTLYVYVNGSYSYVNHTSDAAYSFEIFDGLSYRLIFDGAYYDFACTGNEVFDYDACYYVYGYSCGIDTIKLRDSNGQLVETVSQGTGYDIYDMQIDEGQEYTISFYDVGIMLCYNQTFTCPGSDVPIDFDRCNWVYPPSPWGAPVIIYLWAGYDYNIVVFRDDHGNFIENSQVAIYDKTDNRYLQRWTDTEDGYVLFGARFDTDHDVLLMLRTFDGVFVLDTVYPANGSASVGDEDIVTTNWTIPIKYNLKLYPETPAGKPVFDVFCGLSEYTPYNPGAFWGMDLSGRGYVPVTNCSGFAMCDIVAEKGGYADYNVKALDWTSKTTLIKDYRYNLIMEEE